MANNSSHFSTVQIEILISSVVFKFIAMIIGVLGNITVIICTIFTSKEKTATSYLVGNLALADLLMCLTFYPIWIIELLQTILNIDSNQELFCKLSHSIAKALLFASVTTLLAITVDRFFYIVKPLKYPLLVTKRRVFVAIACIWLTVCCVFIFLVVRIRIFPKSLRSLCFLEETPIFIFIVYFPLTLVIFLNVWILIVAEKQQKRILATTTTNMGDVNGFFHAFKAVKTFSIVVAVLFLCTVIPTVVGFVLKGRFPCKYFCMLWFVIFHFEFYGINSIVNAFIYGMRHIKYRKAFGHILLRIIRCNKLTN